MLNPNKTVTVSFKLDCPACMATGYDAAKAVCVGCKGEECHYINIECGRDFAEALDWMDGPAWDEVYEIITKRGAELHEDAYRYVSKGGICALDDVTCHMTIERGPVSDDTAAFFNSITKGSQQPTTCAKCADGEDCGRGVAECPVQRRSALEAGIPASVIDGSSKLSDHFSSECINAQANHTEEQES